MKNFPYQLKEANLDKGDTILLLSDGLPELENKTGTVFGYSKIQDTFAGIAEKICRKYYSHLKNEAVIQYLYCVSAFLTARDAEIIEKKTI